MRRLCNTIAFIIFWVVGGFIAFGATGETSTGMSVYLGAVAFVCFFAWRSLCLPSSNQ